jgi:hypothetical protein
MAQHAEAASETPPPDLIRKATETRAKDVGRSLARLDPADMSLISIAPGDVVRLVGKQRLSPRRARSSVGLAARWQEAVAAEQVVRQ